MLINLVLGVATMTVCLALQIALLTRALLYYARHQSALDHASFLGTMSVLSGVMFLLMFGNLGQVAIWALLFQFLGEFSEYSTAFYHSAVNFSTLGYGDIVMSEKRKLLGPIQAINGVLMVGMSTAAVMTTLRDAVKHKTDSWAAEHAPQIRNLVDPDK
ncbi:potassium channel family protein [Congregibacter litoralis]|uniref:Ion channel n=1 Tax=Congregibacter litoralis KT71 TaxID=314285 RepID=A4AA65_9GAMM|nr:potassium channel family protein [Congregibacter litoralis]EAQ96942.1 Ion channel [Congregibacter litoralis KT71]